MGSNYRAALWSFRTRVIIPPNTTHENVDLLLKNIFMQGKPDTVANIEVSYRKSELSAPVESPALPFEGCIQISRCQIS
jgi:hypothetical protein